MDNTVLTLLITQGALTIGGLGAWAASEMRARRERKWAKEDLERQTIELKKELKDNKAEVLAQTTETVKNSAEKIAEVHKAQKTNTSKLSKKIDHNTQVSVKAFHEANNVNEKIMSAAERTAALEGRFDGLEEIIYNMERKIDKVLEKEVPKDEDHTATDLFVERHDRPDRVVVTAKRKKPRSAL